MGQVAEFQFSRVAVGDGKEPAGGFVGVKNGEIAADDDASAAEFAQDLRHDIVVAGQLVVEPDIFDGQAQVFQQVEDQLQLRIGKRLAGDMAVKDRHADDGFTVQHRNSDLGSEQFKLPLGFRVLAALLTGSAQDAAEPGDLAADAAFERELEVFEQRRGKAYGAGCAQPAAFFEAQSFAQPVSRLADENGGAVDADQFAQQEQELLEHGIGVERIRQDGRKAAQGAQALVIGLQTGGRQGQRGGRGRFLGWDRDGSGREFGRAWGRPEAVQ
ncbi:MAG: hypothetical protein ABSA69_08955 [Verrucomicrobiota bacterium]